MYLPNYSKSRRSLMPNHNTLKLMRVHSELDLDAVRQILNVKVSTYYSIPPPTEITRLILRVKTTYINSISTN